MESRSKQRMSDDAVRKIVADCQASGMSQADYAKKIGIDPKTLYWYGRRLRRQTRKPRPTAFTQVVSPPVEKPANEGIKINWQRCQVTVSSGIDAKTIASIVEGLRQS